MPKIRGAGTSRVRGFTLVEMSVVLVIVGLILGAAMSLGNTLLQRSRIATTTQKEEAIKTALISFIARNNRLPCPAVPTLAPGTAGYGAEAATPGTCTNVPTSGAGASLVLTGIVPWTALGLTDDAVLDGYYNRFTYIVSGPATALTSTTVAGMRGNISLHTATPIALGAPATGNQSNDCTVNTYNACLAVIAIVSHGANASGAYNSNGARLTLPTGTDEAENTDGNFSLVNKDFSEDTANPFDDILLPATSSDLLAPLSTSGTIKNYQAALVTDFNNVIAATVAYAVTNRTGTAGNYNYHLPPNIAALSLPTTTSVDPWGGGIAYNRVEPFVDSSTTSSNTAITLTSAGPDNVYATADDITKTVTVNDLQPYFQQAGW